nr:MAG TPA: myeloid antimicrobial peptide 27 PEPTIDE, CATHELICIDIN, ALPHA HELIX [Caudoviricetes sp.]DAZ75496.1 MAG TPA: myeloid antimicrobial peptide 27 PEPTIDE, CATHELICIDIN, ALPHA HELIX [Caudoviricetes sp.]
MNFGEREKIRKFLWKILRDYRQKRNYSVQGSSRFGNFAYVAF